MMMYSFTGVAKEVYFVLITKHIAQKNFEKHKVLPNHLL